MQYLLALPPLEFPLKSPPAKFPMKQITLVDAEYASTRKQTRKDLFLIETDRVVFI